MPKTEVFEVVSSNNLSEILTGETGTFVAVPRGSTDIPANAREPEKNGEGCLGDKGWESKGLPPLIPWRPDWPRRAGADGMEDWRANGV